jgi:hypothetical protein
MATGCPDRLSEGAPYSEEEFRYGDRGQCHDEGQDQVSHHLSSSALRPSSVIRTRARMSNLVAVLLLR